MKLKQINKDEKCPNCKKFSLKNKGVMLGPSYQNGPIEETEYWICDNCGAEFEGVEE